MLLSIIIPAFNEENTINKIIDLVVNIPLPNKIKKEIIVVDDGSSDNTKNILQKLNQSKKIVLIRHTSNLGKGAAIRSGLEIACGDIMLIQDADLEYNPKYYQTLIQPILDNKIEVVYGTRLRKMKLKFTGKDKTPMPLHFIANNFLSFLTRIIYNTEITDMETGFKVFSKKVYRSIRPLKANKFDIEPEITAKILKNGFLIYEVDIRTEPRNYCDGKKIQWYDAIYAVITLVKYRF